MAEPNHYPCALCGESLDDERAFRRHLEDTHGFLDSQSPPAPAPGLPPQAPATPPATPQPPPAPVPSHLVIDWKTAAADAPSPPRLPEPPLEWLTPADAPPPPPAPAPPPVADVPLAEPDPPTRQVSSYFSARLSTESVLGAALIVAFFLPWFNVRGLISSSGLGLLSWVPRRMHGSGIEIVIPYLVALIPIGSLAVIVQSRRGRPIRTEATVTGVLAPAVLLYGLTRGDGGTLLKLLDVGAYLTLFLSIALVATARGWWYLRLPTGGEARSRRDIAVIGLVGALVVATVVVPRFVHTRTRADLVAAFGVVNNSPRTNVAASSTRLKAGRQPADAPTTTTSLSTDTTSAATEVAPPGADATSTGVASAGSGSGASSGTRTTSPSGSRSGAASPSPTAHAPAPTSAPRPASPTTVAGGCPSGHPQGQVTSFAVTQHDEDSDNYYVNMSGTVSNQTSATIDPYDADLVYYGPSGQKVDSGSVDLSGTLAPGQSRTWSLKGELIVSSDGPPSRASVSRVNYDWDDFDLSRCPST